MTFFILFWKGTEILHFVLEHQRNRQKMNSNSNRDETNWKPDWKKPETNPRRRQLICKKLCSELTQLNICPFTEWVYQGLLCPHCDLIWGRLDPIDRERNVMKIYYEKYQENREAYSHYLQQIYNTK